MRYLLLPLAFFAATCGEGHPAEVSDLARSSVDLSEPVRDMVMPPPADMARACTMPAPGVYNEFEQIFYAPLTNPTQTTLVSAYTHTIVRNSGAMTRPSPAIPTPSDYHCDFTEKSVDPESCTAPCCAGQASSPTFYFDANGWVMVVTGSCTFQTTSAVSYSATVVDGAGTLIR